MTTNKLFQTVVSFDDLVFTNRNHAYGAYYLRKRYNKYLFLAFLVSFTIVVSAIIGPHILSERNNPVAALPTGDVVVFDGTEPPPPPPPPPAPEPQLAKLSFVPPTIVDSVLNDDDIKIMDETIEGMKNEPPPKELLTYTPPPKQPEIIDETPILFVEEPATFMGGDLNTFRKWVAEHIVYPESAAGVQLDGKVVLQFVVGKKGAVEDIKILRGVDPILDQEAVRVLNSSPVWKPGRQGGRDVRQQFSLPITFKLTK